MTLDNQTREDFARIAPKWAELYETYKFNVMMEGKFCEDNLCKQPYGDETSGNLDIQSSPRCILGEAYGFKDPNYGQCRDCEHFSMALASHGREIKGVSYSAWDEEHFEKTVTAFVKHFKSEHTDIIYNNMPDL